MWPRIIPLIKSFTPLFQLLFNLLTVVMFLSSFTYINVGIAPLTSPPRCFCTMLSLFTYAV